MQMLSIWPSPKFVIGKGLITPSNSLLVVSIDGSINSILSQQPSESGRRMVLCNLQNSSKVFDKGQPDLNRYFLFPANRRWGY